MRKNLKEAILNPTPKNIKKVDKSEFKDDKVYGHFGRYRDYADFDVSEVPDLRSAIAERAEAVLDRYEEQLLERLRMNPEDALRYVTDPFNQRRSEGYITNDDGTQVRYRRFNALNANNAPVREGDPLNQRHNWENHAITDALSRRETPQDRIARMREEIERRRNGARPTLEPVIQAATDLPPRQGFEISDNGEIGPVVDLGPEPWTREWLRDMDPNDSGVVHVPPHMQSDDFRIVITRPSPHADPINLLSMESTVGIKYRNLGRYIVCTDNLSPEIIESYARELVAYTPMFIDITEAQFERAMERVINENNWNDTERDT